MIPSHSLQVYTPGDAGGEQLRLRTVSTGYKGGIYRRESSLYMEGVLYILDVDVNNDKEVIHAFDFDDETIATIDLPGEREPNWPRHSRSKLVEMSGGVCVVTNLGHHRRAGLWLLAADRRWERRCAFELDEDAFGDADANAGNIYALSVAGAWECGGVLVLYLQPAGRVGRPKRDMLVQSYCIHA
ncbi:hypothetical protein ACP4OV_031301 [Aristida adscensionis]